MTDLIEPVAGGLLQVGPPEGSFIEFRQIDATGDVTEQGTYSSWMVVTVDYSL